MHSSCYRRQQTCVAVAASVFSLLLVYTASVSDKDVTCEAPSVEPLVRASVICHFPEDVSQTRRITTVSINKGKTYRDEKIILDCWWLSGERECKIMLPGYSFNGTISHSLTLEIPRVSTEHMGKYACKLGSMDPDNIKPCELKFDLVNSSCSIPSIREMESTTLTCRFSKDMNVTKRNFTVVHLGGEYDDNVDILSCIWQDDQQDCTTAPGYQFNNTITDHLVIGVPRASRDHNGTYACHVMGSDEENFAPCEFIITQVSDKHMNEGSFLTVTVSCVVMLIPVSLLILFIYEWKTRERLMEREHRPAVGPTSLHEITPMTRSSEDRGNDCALSERESETDFTDVTMAVKKMKLIPVSLKLRVVFHLETTGLGMNSHILRIAAASPTKRFFRYVLPRIPIERSAESINKLSFVEGRLCKNGKPVDALTIRQALFEVLEFLGDEPVTLFAHNCRKFFAPILFTAVTACDMLAELDGKITGFVDRLYLFRNVYPGLHYGQRDLYEHFFNESYEAHEEMNDVTSLESLLDLPRVTPEALENNSFGLDYVAQFVRNTAG